MKTLTTHSKSIAWFMGMLVTAVIAGCGSGGDGGNGAGTQAGMLSVSMTDAPACGYDEVNVTVSKVRVHQSGSASENAAGWTDITLNPARKINLLDLNDPTQPNLALEHLGEAPLTAGHYTQLRLVLAPNSNNPPFANSVVLSRTNHEIALDTPSAAHSGIKLIHQFSVASGQHVDLLLDFDACKSIVKRGNGTYALKPVIKVIPFVLNGIKGFVDHTLPNAQVSAQVNGDIVRATMPNSQTGEFFLARLDESVDYAVVITADDHATTVIAGVPVPSNTDITIISTTAVPFMLQTSTTQHSNGTVTLNPADDEATVIVAAKQALVGGPTVTVNSQVATLITNTPTGDYAYDLTLPVGAPSLAAYKTPLPITPSAATQSTVAGKYTIQASSTGYVTQSFNENIALGSVAHDFLLTP